MKTAIKKKITRYMSRNYCYLSEKKLSQGFINAKLSINIYIKLPGKLLLKACVSWPPECNLHCLIIHYAEKDVKLRQTCE